MPTTLDDSESRRAIPRAQAAAIAASGFVSAAVSYLVLVGAARALTAEDNAIFLTYWALLFGLFGVLTGLNAEAARSAYRDDPRARAGARIVPSAMLFGGFVCAIFGLVGVLCASQVLDASHSWLFGIAVLAGAAFSGHLALTGVLAGQGRWSFIIVLGLTESIVRATCVLIAILNWPSLEAIAMASAASATSWLLMVGRPRIRAALADRGEAPTRVALLRFAQACVATGSSAALIVGFPVLIRFTTERTEFLASAGLLLAISLTRAPLIVPLNALQGVTLRYLLHRRAQGVRALRQPLIVILAVTVVTTVAAAAAGPALFRLMFGSGYSATPFTLAALTVSAGMLAGVLVTGIGCVAAAEHAAFATGWLVATTVAFLGLLLPIDLHIRAPLALVCGPFCGALVHCWAMMRANSCERTYAK